MRQVEVKQEHTVQILSCTFLSGRDSPLPGIAMCATHHMDASSNSGLLPFIVGVGAVLATSILVACGASRREASTRNRGSTTKDSKAKNSNARWTDPGEAGQLECYPGAIAYIIDSCAIRHISWAFRSAVDGAGPATVADHRSGHQLSAYATHFMINGQPARSMLPFHLRDPQPSMSFLLDSAALTVMLACFLYWLELDCCTGAP